MKPPTIDELRKFADEEDKDADFAQFQLNHSKLTRSERATKENMKRKARIYAHALREWADRLEAHLKYQEQLP